MPPRPWPTLTRWILALALSLPTAACGEQEQAARAQPVTVFAAASLTDVLKDVAAEWKQDGGAEVRFSFAATSKLVPQVIEGAPADALFSADEAWMEKLAAAGKVADGSRAVVARNELVFVVPSGSPVPEVAASLPGFLKKIALAGENVPAGKYARAALQHAKVWSQVEPRVVPADDVRLALKWVASGEVDGGVVYRTDAKAEPKVVVAFGFPAESHPPIVYPAAAIKGAAQELAGRRFVEYCRGPKARAIFEQYGFLPAP